jgi:hypothetical protein
VTGIARAEVEHPRWIRRVEWSDDRTTARLSGPGFAVVVTLDERNVHFKGTVPIFPRLLERPVRRFVAEVFKNEAPPPPGPTAGPGQRV